jgi:hypothetical protein
MQPFPTSSHSWTCSPPLLTVKVFSISEADAYQKLEVKPRDEITHNLQILKDISRDVRPPVGATHHLISQRSSFRVVHSICNLVELSFQHRDTLNTILTQNIPSNTLVDLPVTIVIGTLIRGGSSTAPSPFASTSTSKGGLSSSSLDISISKASESFGLVI